jgi:hypothetical protein
MTTTKIMTFVDRIALGVMNAMALVGLPLVAAGLVVQSF